MSDISNVLYLIDSFKEYVLCQGSGLSAITSLYMVSCLLQVVGGRSMINNVAGVILYNFMKLNVRVLNEGNAYDGHNDKHFLKCLSEVEGIVRYAPESNGAERINGDNLGAQLEDLMSCMNITDSNGTICSERLVFYHILSLFFTC